MIASGLTARIITRLARPLIPQMEAEVAALGRSSSEHTDAITETPGGNGPKAGAQRAA